MKSKRKGKSGELEFARLLTAEGFRARRGQQFAGSPESPDIVCDGLPAIHFEVKRSERLSLYDALAQGRADAGEKLPIVAHRRNHSEWLAILSMTDLLAILRESSLCGAPEIKTGR